MLKARGRKFSQKRTAAELSATEKGGKQFIDLPMSWRYEIGASGETRTLNPFGAGFSYYSMLPWPRYCVV